MLMVLLGLLCPPLPPACPHCTASCPASVTNDLPCPPGLLCPPGAAAPVACPFRHYCRNGTATPCPLNSVVGPNATGPDACICTGGFFGPGCADSNYTRPSVPLSLNSMPMAGVSLGQVLCQATGLATSLSQLYGSAAGVVQCTAGNVSVACPNFTCPCNVSARRRLLQTDVVALVFQVHSAAAPTVDLLQAAVAQALPAATVSQVVVIATQPYSAAAAAYQPLSSWGAPPPPPAAAAADNTGLIAGMVVLGAVLVGAGAFLTWWVYYRDNAVAALQQINVSILPHSKTS